MTWTERAGVFVWTVKLSNGQNVKVECEELAECVNRAYVLGMDVTTSVKLKNGLYDFCVFVIICAEFSEGREWILDSGATHHMCADETLLFGTEPAHLTIRVANSTTMTATLKGNWLLEMIVNGTRRSILLTNVYFCKSLGRNLLSLSQLRRSGLSFSFTDTCTFHSRDGSIVAEAIEHKGLWIVNSTTLGSPSSGAHAYFVSIQTSSLQRWHERLGHTNYQDLMRMTSKNLASGIALANKKASFCIACAEGKQSPNMQPVEDTSDSAPTDELGVEICVDGTAPSQISVASLQLFAADGE